MANVGVHSTAIVDSQAQLGNNVTIGPFSLIGPGAIVADDAVIGAYTQVGARHACQPTGADAQENFGIVIGPRAVIGSQVTIGNAVELAADTRVGHGAILHGPLIVGAGSRVFDGAIIGGPPQYPGRHAFEGRIEIGTNVTIRELVLINKPVLTAATVIGDDCYLMSRTQIDHDCRLDHHVKTACGVTLGGSVQVDAYAYLGMNAVVHQGLRIGAETMVGMNAAVTKHIPPFAVLVGQSFARINRHGLKLRGATAAEMDAIETYYRTLMNGADSRPAGSARVETVRSFYAAIGDAAAFRPSFV